MHRSSQFLLVAICALGLWGLCGAQVPLSPCPRVFQYQTDGSEFWGIIHISSPPFVSTGVKLLLNIKMSIGVQLPTRYVGRLELLGHRGEVLQELIRGGLLRYRVHFPLLNPLPKITSITFNGNIVCQGPPAHGGYVTSINLDHKLETGGVNQGGFSRPSYNYPGENFNGYNQIYPMQNTNNNNYDPNTIIIEIPNNSDEKNQDNEITTQKNPNNNLGLGDVGNQEYELVPTGNGEYIVVYNKKPTPDDFARPVRVRPQVSTESPSAVNPQGPGSADTDDDTLENRNQITFKCGVTRQVSNPLVIGGDSVSRGDWPWLVAIFVKKVTGIDFICAGTLISNKHIVSAAHCVRENGNRPVKVNELVLKVGVYNIQDWTDENTKTMGIEKMEFHPDFKENQVLNSDIVILILSRTVTFSEYIVPACLWEGDPDLDLIVGQKGAVVGWGRDENGLKATPEPRLAEVPIVSTETCRESRVEFQLLTNSRTMCGGERNGTGPCNGDSGGGLYLSRDNRWMLRGVVSNSLKDPGSFNTCNLHEYLIFTDTAKYDVWIKGVLNKP